MNDKTLETRPTIILVSDSTGTTASVLSAVGMKQYSLNADERLFHGVHDKKRIVEKMEMAKAMNAAVIFTFVDEDMREFARMTAEDLGVHAVDGIGPLMRTFGAWSGREPLGRPMFPFAGDTSTNEAYHFAELHDDGENQEGLVNADAVILALSRVGKTPVCQELARRRKRAGNVPITPDGAPLSDYVMSLDPRRVFVLKMSSKRLVEVRGSRSFGDPVVDAKYVDPDIVEEHCRFVTRLVTRNGGWTLIDVTKKAPEETAARIIEMLQQKGL